MLWINGKASIVTLNSLFLRLYRSKTILIAGQEICHTISEVLHALQDFHPIIGQDQLF